jgi:hypothetical protein
MALCDKLDAQLTSAKTESRRLLKAMRAEELQHNVALTGG